MSATTPEPTNQDDKAPSPIYAVFMLLAVAGSICFGFWVGSLMAGIWMFCILQMAVFVSLTALLKG